MIIRIKFLIFVLVEVGKTYKLKKYSSVKEEFRGKEFTLVRTDDIRAYIKIENDNDIRNFKIEKWNDYVLNEEETWQGNRLRFKFV